jgi:hypothetical protein
MLTLHILHFAFEVSWPLLNAYVEAESAAAGAVEVAGVAAAEAAAAVPALLLGAGLLGWEIGDQLRKHFLPDNPERFPAPFKPFTGGQQRGRLYDVTFTQAEGSSGLGTATIGAYGPISATYEYNVSETLIGYAWASSDGIHSQGASTEDDWEARGIPSVISVVPHDGMPDLDKNPPYAYAPTIQVPGVLNPTKPFPFLPGNPNLPMEIVPFKRPNKTTDPDTTDPNQEEEPGVIVKIPDLGTQITFTPGGADIQSYNPTDTARAAPQQDSRKSPPKAATEVCDCPCDVSEVLAKIKEVKDEEDEIKKLVEPKEYDHHTAVRLSGSGGSFTLQPYCRAVRVQVTVFPSNREGYDGNGGPDIVFAGWHAFGGAGVFGGERVPIQYYDNVYLAPENAGTFTYGLKTGYEGIVTEYYDTLKES